jgi:uroporphyrinogen decarboxylase
VTGEAAVTTSWPFIEACFGRPHDRVPVWMMRQAGRYLPEYRAVRERHSFLDMCFLPEVATEVTLQPIRRFAMDAAIIFSDILIFLPALGLDVQFPGGGPQITNPIQSTADVDRLGALDAERAIPQVYEAIRRAVAGLEGERPLIGFCGAPFTLACYAIEGKGSKDWSHAKAFLYRDPSAARSLLDKLADAAIAHLDAQIAAGATAVQIFDSWAGVLSRRDFEAFGKPYLARIVAAVRRPGLPVIVFARGVPPAWLGDIGADLYNFDWRVDLREACGAVAPAGVQGNLDPAFLLGPRERAVKETERILTAMNGVPRFVFNLGHGVLPQTDPDTVKAVVDTVHEWTPGKTS